jgi:chromosome segregation ATPase
MIDKIEKLENAKAQLCKELEVVKKRAAAEQEQIDGLSQTMTKIEASQGGLMRDLTSNENKLKAVSDQNSQYEYTVQYLQLQF